MTRYPYLLFDADNTLFDFDEANVHAFRAVCDAFGLPFSQELFDRYEVINNATWERFDRGELTKDETVLERFRTFFAAEGIRGLDPTACNRVHLASLSNATYLMPHAAEVVAKLRETHHIHLITNAVEAVQRGRLGRRLRLLLHCGSRLGFQGPADFHPVCSQFQPVGQRRADSKTRADHCQIRKYRIFHRPPYAF